MATRKKKAKKKIARRHCPSTAELTRLEIAQVLDYVKETNAGLTAMREAIERLDLTVAKALAEAAKQVYVDPTLFPGPQDGGVPERVAMAMYDGDTSINEPIELPITVHTEPTDKDLLA